MKHFIWLSSLLAISSALAGTPASYDPSSDLLTFFKDKCPSFNGPLTNSALVQSNALVSIMDSMKNDPNCQSVKSSLDDIQRLSQSDIFQSSQDEVDRDQLRNQTNDMELAVNAERARGNKGDSDFIATLQSQIATNRASLALTSNKANETRARNRLKAIGDLEQFSVAAFNQLDSNQNCLSKYPNLPAQLGAQILSLSGGFSSGIIGSLMMTGGEFIDRFLKFIRDRKMSDGIKKITQVSQGYGIGCAVEGLASTYCEARDADSLLLQRVHGIEKNDNANSSKAFMGVGILTNNLASYSDWIAHTNAASPSDTTAAQKQTAVLNLQTAARTTQLQLSAQFREAQQKITSMGADPQAELRRFMESVQTSSTATMADIYNDVFSADRQCGYVKYMFTGGKEKVSGCNAAEAADCYACVLAKNNGVFPNSDTVKAGFDALFADMNNRVAQKVSNEIENHPERLLLSIDVRGANGSAPIDFIENSKEFVAYLLTQKDFATGRRAKSIKSLKARLDTALSALNDDDEEEIATTKPTVAPTTKPAAGHSADTSAGRTIDVVREQLAPKDDPYFIPDELQLLNKLYIQYAQDKNMLTPEVATIMQLSPSDSLGTMMQAYVGLETTRSQINSAKRITFNNLQVLGNLFEDEMTETLKKMTEYSSLNHDNADRNLYCMRMTLIPRAKDKSGLGQQSRDQFERNFDQYCQGAQYHSLLDPNLVLDYDQLLKGNFEDRVCSVYDFFRKARIKEQLKNSKKSGSH